MNKNKKTLTNDINKIIELNANKNCVRKESLDINDTSIVVEFYDTITFKEYAQMISDMTSLVFTDGSYYAFSHSLAFDLVLIKYFTNIAIDDVNQNFELICKTDVVKILKEVINSKLLEYIKADFENSIKHQQQLIYHSSEWDEIASSLKILLDSLLSLSKDINKDVIEKLLNAVKTVDNNKQEVAEAILNND